MSQNIHLMMISNFLLFTSLIETWVWDSSCGTVIEYFEVIKMYHGRFSLYFGVIPHNSDMHLLVELLLVFPAFSKVWSHDSAFHTVFHIKRWLLIIHIPK